MRVMFKGGFWKNSEDEVLKAAVMKYGLNQWARISSLLVKKSAKQCKARWHEWLDPCIKKTEWSRPEDEKLMYLARIFPNLWRTIADRVGRTAAQCLERYDKLLREEQQRQGLPDPIEKEKYGDLGYKEKEHPESVPAKPDPKSMDPDEREMLSEARARLANTKGKKAKRKAREKQLQAARRLASLQKRRELRMAGISTGKRKRRKHWIDYSREIPFQQSAPRGLYDTIKEDRQAKQVTSEAKKNFRRGFQSDFEGENRDAKEAKERKKDLARTKMWRKSNLPEVLRAEAALNAVEAISHRPELKMPEAQVTDQDLRDINKLQSKAAIGGTSGVTKILMDGSEAMATPGRKLAVRTPMRQNGVSADASILLEMNSAQTPLLGGTNMQHSSKAEWTSTPGDRQSMTTPNMLLQNSVLVLKDGKTPVTPGGGSTPGSVAQTPGQTPSDRLNINTPGKQSKRGRKRKRKELKEAFKLLPVAHNEYEIFIPEMDDEVHNQEEIVQDQMDIEARKQQERLRKREAEMKRQTQVIQQRLDRPRRVNKIRTFRDELDNNKREASELINKEILQLMQHDNEAFPLSGKPPKKRRKHQRTEYTDEDLQLSKDLIQEELQRIKSSGGETHIKNLNAFCDGISDDAVLIPSKQQFQLASDCSMQQTLEGTKQEFYLLRQQLVEKMRKSQKLSKKTNIVLGGYQKIVRECTRSVATKYKDYVNEDITLQEFKYLERAESKAMPMRVAEWRRLVKIEKGREREVQYKFKAITEELNRAAER